MATAGRSSADLAKSLMAGKGTPLPSSSPGGERSTPAVPGGEPSTSPAAPLTKTTPSGSSTARALPPSAGGEAASWKSSVEMPDPSLPPHERFKLLAEGAYPEVFGMDKAAFDALPEWKRKDLRKKAKLF